MSLTFTPITSQFASIASLNGNFDKITSWSATVLTSSGGTLQGDVDANGQKILNVGAPSSPTDLVRLMDLDTGGLNIDNLVPAQSGNSGRVLGTDGVSVSWVVAPGAPGSGITTLTAGSGLTGGTITTFGTIALSTTGVTAAPYGTASAVAIFTVDSQGRITDAEEVPILITKAQVTDLGTVGTMAAESSASFVRANNGVVTSALTRQGQGAHLWHSSSTYTSGRIFFQPQGTPPSMSPGDILFEW